MNAQTRAYLTLFFGVFAFGFSPIFVTLAGVSGLTATLYRSGVAATVLLIPFVVQRRGEKRREDVDLPLDRPNLPTTLKIAGIAGTLFAINNGLFNTAVTLIPASNAIFLANTAVVWVGLISMVIYKERLSRNFWIGVPLALGGVLLITTQGTIQTETMWLGNIIALAGGFFYGLNILYNTVARRTLNAIPYTMLFNAVACLLLFVVILIVGVPYRGFDSATYGYLFALGFIAQAMGFLAVVQAQAYLPASKVSTILLAQPLLVLILAFIILHEQPSPIQLVGMVILFAGIVLANRR